MAAAARPKPSPSGEGGRAQRGRKRSHPFSRRGGVAPPAWRTPIMASLRENRKVYANSRRGGVAPPALILRLSDRRPDCHVGLTPSSQ